MLFWTYPEKKLGRGHFRQSFTNSLEPVTTSWKVPGCLLKTVDSEMIDSYCTYDCMSWHLHQKMPRWTRLLTINMTILYFSIFYFLFVMLLVCIILHCLTWFYPRQRQQWRMLSQCSSTNLCACRLTVPEPVPLRLFYRGRESRHKWAGRLHLSNFHTTGASIIWRKSMEKMASEKKWSIKLVCFSWNWKQFLQILSQTLEAQLAGQPELCDVIRNRKISCDEISSIYIVFDWL